MDESQSLAPVPRNVNVGVLGHVDSGKTALVKILSEQISTAALDKHPQSQQRGITLDLGFTSFIGCGSSTDQQQQQQDHGDDEYAGIRCTLVDCPGHASLLKMVIGASQIIDTVLLVIDVNKMIQAQTAECIALAEIFFGDHQLVVALNKIDLLDEQHRESMIEKAETKMRKVFQHLGKFADAPMVPISCLDTWDSKKAIMELKRSLFRAALNRRRTLCSTSLAPQNSFILSVDHCFMIKGQGNVVTGTLLRGCIKVGNMLELPLYGQSRKIKSIQVFRTPVETAAAGDRIAVCLANAAATGSSSKAPASVSANSNNPNFDFSSIERAIACAPDALRPTRSLLLCAHAVKFHKHSITSGIKYHVSVGHALVTGQVTFLSPLTGLLQSKKGHLPRISLAELRESVFARMESLPLLPDASRTDSIENELRLAVVELEHPVVALHESIVLGSRFDLEYQAKNECRLAFYGENMLQDNATLDLATVESANWKTQIQIGVSKTKTGVVDRIGKDGEIIVRGLAKKDSDPTRFLGMQLLFYQPDIVSAGTPSWTGKINRAFGKSGKFVVTDICKCSDHNAPIQEGSVVRLEYIKVRSIADSHAPAKWIQHV